MINTLSNIQPLLIIVLLGLFFTLETYFPYLTRFGNRKKHTFRNLGLLLVTFMAYGIAGSWYTYWLSNVHQHGWGLLNILHLSPAVSVITGVILVDLDSYAGHFAFHKIPVRYGSSRHDILSG